MVNAGARRRSSEFAAHDLDLEDQLTSIHQDDEVEEKFKTLTEAKELGEETEEDKKRAELHDRELELEQKRLAEVAEKEAKKLELEKNRPKKPKKVQNKVTKEWEEEKQEEIILSEEEEEILRKKREKEERDEARRKRMEMSKKELMEIQKLKQDRLKAKKVILKELRVLSIHDEVTILPVLYPVTAKTVIKKLAAALSLSPKGLYIVYLGKSFHEEEIIPEECLTAEKFNFLRWVNDTESNYFHKYMNVENLRKQVKIQKKKEEEERLAKLNERRRSSIGAAGGTNALSAQDIRKAAQTGTPVVSSESESDDGDDKEDDNINTFSDESTDEFDAEKKPGTAESLKKKHKRKKKKGKETLSDDDDLSGESFDPSDLQNELANLTRPLTTSSTNSSRPSTMSRRKKKRRPSSELRERGFLLSYELAQINCKQYVPLLEKAGFNDMGAFAYIKESELKGPPLWIPNRPTRRILGLADVFKRQIELKGVSKTSSYMKRLKEKKGTYTVDGVNFFQTAHELQEYVDRKNAPKPPTPPREKSILKKHEESISIKIKNIRQRIKEENALNSEEPPFALLLKYRKKKREEEISLKLAKEKNKAKIPDSRCRHNPSGNSFCCKEHSTLLEKDYSTIIATDAIDYQTYFDLAIENANRSKADYLPRSVYEKLIEEVLVHFKHPCYPKIINNILKEACTNEEYNYFDVVIIKKRVIELLMTQRNRKIQEKGI